MRGTKHGASALAARADKRGPFLFGFGVQRFTADAAPKTILHGERPV
jgi:hypothetical protein